MRAPDARGALFALASFDYEIRHALKRARDPNLTAMRLAWWREVDCRRTASRSGRQPGRACASRGDRRLRAAPSMARGDAGRAPAGDRAAGGFQPTRLFAPSPMRARARACGLASRIAAEGQDLDPADAHAPAGMALALTRLLKELPFKAGSAPTLIPADVAARHGVSVADFDARRASPRRYCRLRRTAGVGARRTCRGRASAEEFKPRDPAGLHSARPLAARPRPARPQRGPPVRRRGRGLAAPPAMGDLAMGADAISANCSSIGLAPAIRVFYLAYNLA